MGRNLLIIASGSQSSSVVIPQPAPTPAGWKQVPPWVVGIVLVVITGLAVWGLVRQPDTSAEVLRFRMAGPEVASTLLVPDFALSPDGTQIVYRGFQSSVGSTQFYLRRLDELEATPLRGTENWFFPFFSPDGEWIGFHGEAGNLERVSVFGGAPERVARLPHAILGASWGTDDQMIVGTQGGGLFRVPANGGDPEELTTLDTERGERSHRWPSIIPDHQAVLFVAARDNTVSNSQLAALALDTGEVMRLGLTGTSPRYVATGHLVYVADDGSLRAVLFNPDQLAVIWDTCDVGRGRHGDRLWCGQRRHLSHGPTGLHAELDE